MKLRITVQGIQYEVEVEVLEDSEQHGAAPSPTPQVAPARPVAVAAPSPAAPPPPAAAPKAPSSGGKPFPSPLAGTVRAVNVTVGKQVNANDELFVLEAMKMETSVCAPTGGTIKAILVNVGDAVQSGQTLVEFE